MGQRSNSHANESHEQLQRFRELARELGCGENEAAFEAALKKLTKSDPLPKHEPKKRQPKG
jgi:hypothetical protein